MKGKIRKKHYSLANLAVRLIFIVFSVLMALILLFSYQFSTTAVQSGSAAHYAAEFESFCRTCLSHILSPDKMCKTVLQTVLPCNNT